MGDIRIPKGALGQRRQYCHDADSALSSLGFLNPTMVVACKDQVDKQHILGGGKGLHWRGGVPEAPEAAADMDLTGSTGAGPREDQSHEKPPWTEETMGAAPHEARNQPSCWISDAQEWAKLQNAGLSSLPRYVSCNSLQAEALEDAHH